MESVPAGRKIAFTALISTGLRMFGMAAALAITAVITRRLGPDGFGTYSTIFAILLTFSLFGDFGLRQLLVRELARHPSSSQTILAHVLFLRLITTIAAFGVAALFAFALPQYDARIERGILIGFFVMVPLSLTQVLGGLFQHRFHYERISIAETIGRVIQLGGVLVVLKVAGGLFSFLFAAAAGSLVTFSLVFYWAGGGIVRRIPSLSWGRTTDLLREAWPLAVSLVSILIYFKLDTILLSLLRAQREVGLYNIAYKIFESTLFFPALIAGLGMPLLAARSRSQPAFRAIFRKLTEAIMSLALPAAVGLIVLAEPILEFISGGEFLEAAQALRILAFTLLAVFPAHIFAHAIIAIQKQRESMKVYIGGAVLNVILNLAVIPAYGFVGAAWTTLATEVGVTLWLGAILRQSGYYAAEVLFYCKPVIAAILMGATIALVAGIFKIHVLVLIVIGAMLYVGLLTLMNASIIRECARMFWGAASDTQ